MESALKIWGSLWFVAGILSFLNILATPGGGFGAFMSAITVLGCTVVPFILLHCTAKLWENIHEIKRRKSLKISNK